MKLYPVATCTPSSVQKMEMPKEESRLFNNGKFIPRSRKQNENENCPLRSSTVRVSGGIPEKPFEKQTVGPQTVRHPSVWGWIG